MSTQTITWDETQIAQSKAEELLEAKTSEWTLRGEYDPKVKKLEYTIYHIPS